MIYSFSCRETEGIFAGKVSSSLPRKIQKVARRMLNNAQNLLDLRIPPNNRLEKLSGDHVGQWSIHINDQWRICFIWDDGNAWNVEIVDYH